MAFKEFWDGAVRYLTARLTPVSGSKRRREDSGPREHEDQRKSQAARTAQASGKDALKSSQAPAQEFFVEKPSYGHVFIEPQPTFSGFDMAGRVRELAPRQGCDDVAPNGSARPTQGPLDSCQQQSQPSRQLDYANAIQPERMQPSVATGTAGQPPAPQAAFSIGAGAAAPRRTPHLFARPQQPYPQPQMQPQGQTHLQPGARAVAAPQHAGSHFTPGAGPSFGAPPAYSGHQTATPRQLFTTPDSTMRRFEGLRLVGGTPRVPAGAAPSRLAGLVTNRDGNYFSSFDSATTAAATSAAAAGSAAVPNAGAVGHVALSAMPPPPPRFGYMAPAYHGQATFLQHHQQLQRLPFPTAFTYNLRELTSAQQGTKEELQQILRTYEASARARAPAPSPLREDGGYVAGDDDDEGTKRTSALAQETRATLERLRSGLAATVRKASSNPQVAAAAVGSRAARTALEASQAAAGADALAAIGIKVATHEEMVRQVRAAAEETTRLSVEAVKADEAAQRVRMGQRQQELRRGMGLGTQPSPPAPAAPAAAAAARAAPPMAASGRRPAAAAAVPLPLTRGRKPAPAPAANEDVLDLVSSEEEGEEEGEEEEEEGAEGEGEELEGEDDAADPYGVEYGAYPGEERSRGTPALRYGNRPERSTWRRTMDPAANPGEMLLEYRPNKLTEIELSRAKLQCMQMGVWLNDEVINLYMLLLQERDTRLRRAAAAQAGGRAALPTAPRCHFFNSFFYNKLFQDEGAYNYANVRRWTAPKQLSIKLQDSPGLLELDRIIMPIHKGVHWTCAEVDLKARAVRYYDSLMGEDSALARHLLSWVSDEAADKLKQRWDTSNWSVEFPKQIPEQHNGCDCGVFSIMFADRLGAGLPLDFRQCDMPLLRIQVLHRLVNMRVD